MLRVATIAGIASFFLVACGNSDTVVKTDLDERYIVKASAVEKIRFDWTKEIKERKSNIKYREEYIDDILRRKNEFCAKRPKSPGYECGESYRQWTKPNEIDLAKQQRELHEIRRISELQTDQKEILAKIKFRTIFQDINGGKTPHAYKIAFCLNPKVIGSEDSEKLFTLLDLRLPDAERKNTVEQSSYLSMAKKLCDKYAFTDTVFFDLKDAQDVEPWGDNGNQD